MQYPYTNCHKEPNFQSRCVFSTPGIKSWSSVIKEGQSGQWPTCKFSTVCSSTLSSTGGITSSHQPLVYPQNHHPCGDFSKLPTGFKVFIPVVFSPGPRSVGRISTGLPWCGWQDLSLPYSGWEHQGLFDLVGEDGEFWGWSSWGGFRIAGRCGTNERCVNGWIVNSCSML